MKGGSRCGEEGERATIWGLHLYFCLESLDTPGRGQAEIMCRTDKGHLKSINILVTGANLLSILAGKGKIRHRLFIRHFF